MATIVPRRAETWRGGVGSLVTMGLFDVFNHRARDLMLTAGDHHLMAAEDDPFGCYRAPFALMHRGISRNVTAVLWRPKDTHAVRVFDYRYFSNVGNNTVPSPLFTCATALANAAWPYLSVMAGPRTFGITHRFDEHHDFDMLDPTFTEAFDVRTADDHFATAMLDTEMRYFLLEHARALDIQFNGAWLMASAEQIPVDLVPDVFGFIDDLLKHIPKVVGELYQPPLKGDLDTPMPDPGLLLRLKGASPDAALAIYDRREASSAEQLVSTVLGHNREVPGFGATVFGSEAAELAIDQDIMDDRAWSEVESPILALDDPTKPDSGFDLDGNPITPHKPDPWGDGRPLPHHGSGPG